MTINILLAHPLKLGVLSPGLDEGRIIKPLLAQPVPTKSGVCLLTKFLF